VRIPVDSPDLSHIETVSQAELNRCYVEMLQAQLKRLQTTILTAQVLCRIGDTHRAYAVLSQGAQS
jgi:hypothetical protein